MINMKPQSKVIYLPESKEFIVNGFIIKEANLCEVERKSMHEDAKNSMLLVDENPINNKDLII